MRFSKHFSKSMLFRLGILGAGGILVLAISLWVFYLLVEIPSIQSFEEREIPESTKIYDSTGEVLLWEIHGEEKRTIVPFEKISRHVKNATIAIEDKSFYSHSGINPLSILRALFVDVLRNKRQGGSTITQQLVKNTLLTPEQTIRRKLKEMVIAIKLETVYSKDEILNLYLNEIPYGSNAYGIEAGAQTYFGKKAEELTLAESAYLAALPKAPSYYSPYGNHHDELEQRKNVVLARMEELGFITKEEHENAKNEKVAFLQQQKHGLRAPHFVMYVRELLSEKYGEDMIERGGLRVITTLDMKMQEKAEEILARRVAENTVKFRATNGGTVIVEPTTGRILAMVGSKDYFDIEHGGNFNTTLARRQPGSTFKPIVYAAAFKKGYTPETVLFDLQTNFSVGGEPYIPKNFDEKFRGPVTMRQSLAQSLNVTSVKTFYLAGMQESIDTARDFGITTLTDKSRYGLSLVLGGGEMTLLELTSAYGVFATQGTHIPHHPIIEVKDRSNNVVYKEEKVEHKVLDPNVANMISSILTDNEARTPTFGPRSPLYFEQGNVAVKTGTTNDYRDAWTIGYTGNIAVGMWNGNNDNSSMTKNVAGFIVAPAWRELMDEILKMREPTAFTPPIPTNPKKPVLRGIWQGSRSYTTTQNVPELIPFDQQNERVIQEVHSILYWVDKNDPDGPIPTNPARDPQFYAWEIPVRAWAAQNGYNDESPGGSIFGPDPNNSPENLPQVTLPQNEVGASFTENQTIVFHPSINAKLGVARVEVYVDESFIRSESQAVSEISINTKSSDIDVGDHTLVIRVYDTAGNRGEGRFLFRISGRGR